MQAKFGRQVEGDDPRKTQEKGGIIGTAVVASTDDDSSLYADLLLNCTLCRKKGHRSKVHFVQRRHYSYQADQLVLSHSFSLTARKGRVRGKSGGGDERRRLTRQVEFDWVMRWRIQGLASRRKDSKYELHWA